MYWDSKISGFASPVVKTGPFQSSHFETLFGVLGLAALRVVIISLLVA